MSLCIVGGGVAVQLAVASFTLAWTHTVERTEWRETWRVEEGRLVLEEARVKGSGAGIDPPPEARLEGGFYVWRPNLMPLPAIVLRRAPQAGDWRLCAGDRCAPLGEWLGRHADPVRLTAASGGCPPEAKPPAMDAGG
jgi:hypothetical protein